MVIRIAAFAVLLLFICAPISCKSDRGNHRLEDTISDSKSYEIIKREIENADVPREVEPEIFESLRAALLAEIERLYGANSDAASGVALRIPAAAPEGAAGKVTDLAFDFESGTLSWSYANTGDYDLSGDTGIPDITPIALNYAKTAEYLPGGKPAGDIETPGGLENHRLAWIDGDKNGEIGISDVTPIALNYLANVAAYRIFTSQTPGGPLLQIGADIPIGQTGAFPILFSAQPPEGAKLFVAVAPVDALGSAGPMSNLVALSADAPPVISGVTPQGGESGAQVTFSADIAGSPPYVYSWNFGGASTPNVSADALPAVILGAPGVYPASVAVSNAAGSDQFNFILNVTGANTPPQIISVSPLFAEETELVYFTAVISGSPPFNYAWDFGGGALPNISNFASPQVTIGAAGEYECSLIAANAFGADTFHFTLGVSAYNEPPVAAASVTPYVADSPGTFTLFTTGSGDPDGTIVKYEWDFESDGFFDYESGSPAPVEHIYPGEAAGGPREGKYRARLRVTDDKGKTATAQTPVFISNDAHLYWTWEWVDGGTEVGYNAGGGRTMLIDPRDGRPCMVYFARFENDYLDQIKFAWKNLDGTWEFDSFVLSEFLSQNRTPLFMSAAFLPDGTAVVALQERIRFPVIDDRLDCVWRLPDGSWRHDIVDDEGRDNGENPILALDPDNNPAIVYGYQTDDNSLPVYEVRLAAHDGADWQIQPVDRGSLPYLRYTDFKFIDGVPCLLWNTQSSLNLVSLIEGIWTERLISVPPVGSFKNYSSMGILDNYLTYIAANAQTYDVTVFKDSEPGVTVIAHHMPMPDVVGILPGNPAVSSVGWRQAVAFSEVVPSMPNRVWLGITDGVSWREEPILESSAGYSNGLLLDESGYIFMSVYNSWEKELFFGIREPFLDP